MAAETVELHKLKLAELKQECLARGLEAKGNKQDLINRLQAYLEEHAEEEANEEDVLGEEIEEEEQKPVEPPAKVEEPPVKSPDVITEKKVVKITSEISQMERMQKRAERFNVPVSLESKKAARAARFGLATVSTKGLSADSKPTVNMDKLKERAQRFGLNVSSLSKKTNDKITVVARVQRETGRVENKSDHAASKVSFPRRCWCTHLHAGARPPGAPPRVDRCGDRGVLIEVIFLSWVSAPHESKPVSEELRRRSEVDCTRVCI
ncbi:SAP domain-containing ribonucleoprotein isoform X1 [Falco naumanni]|uniref:SAP domain-containing ribonucleoprotein isoform X1 n=1 Tax=Falco naumanni TaxID=148594 RepID=UPI001ADE9E29|nr:SAP domain-containing ribonucleoprotein isoform X1 [Falco naumanni]